MTTLSQGKQQQNKLNTVTMQTAVANVREQNHVCIHTQSEPICYVKVS